MSFSILSGFLQWSFWELALLALGLTHCTIVSVTLYLHRAEAHRSLLLSPALAHAFRFWLWFTTGMKTKEWVAVHRKHHARCETPDDPHSPQIYGLPRVLFGGITLYRKAAADPDTLAHYGRGTPDDLLERRLYVPHPWLGIGIMALIECALFGLSGLLVLAVQLVWIPFWAAGVINGVGHHSGYRGHDTPDASTNIVPIGIVIGGEELHNNHHAFPWSAKFSTRWYEWDIGWGYIRVFALLRLLRVKRRAPLLRYGDPRDPDQDLLAAIAAHRLAILHRYVSAMRSACRAELRALRATYDQKDLRELRSLMALLLSKDSSVRTSADRERLAPLLAAHPALALMDRMRADLTALLRPDASPREGKIHSLAYWCRFAEESRIPALERFSRSLRRVSAA